MIEYIYIDMCTHIQYYTDNPWKRDVHRSLVHYDRENEPVNGERCAMTLSLVAVLHRDCHVGQSPPRNDVLLYAPSCRGA